MKRNIEVPGEENQVECMASKISRLELENVNLKNQIKRLHDSISTIRGKISDTDIYMEQILRDFKKRLEECDGVLLAWHSNIAMWIHDNCGIRGYVKRNSLACRFVKFFYRIDYDWRKLLGYTGGE